MPARSEAQRKWAFAVKGEAWARKHHMDNPGKLPARVKAKKPKAKSKPKAKPKAKQKGAKRRKGK